MTRIFLLPEEKLVQCSKCQAVFVYTDNDVKVSDKKYVFGRDTHCVECPACNQKIQEIDLKNVLLLNSTAFFAR